MKFGYLICGMLLILPLAALAEREIFTCHLVGVYLSPESRELYRFNLPSAKEVVLNSHPQEFGGTGSKGGYPLSLNVMRSGEDISLGLHDGKNLYIARAPKEAQSLELDVIIQSHNFGIRCLRKAK